MKDIKKITRSSYINTRYRLIELNDKNYLVDYSNPLKLSSYMGLYGAYESVLKCWELKEEDVNNL